MNSINPSRHRRLAVLLACSLVSSAYTCEPPTYHPSIAPLTDGMLISQAGAIRLTIATAPATTLDHVTYFKQQGEGPFEVVAEFAGSQPYDWEVDASQNGLVRWVAAVSSPTGGFGITPLVTVDVDVGAATGPSHPAMFINQQEIDAIQVKIAADQEPWTSAYDQMISAANAALSKSAESVVDNGGGCVDANPHVFATDGVKNVTARRSPS